MEDVNKYYDLVTVFTTVDREEALNKALAMVEDDDYVMKRVLQSEDGEEVIVFDSAFSISAAVVPARVGTESFYEVVTYQHILAVYTPSGPYDNFNDIKNGVIEYEGITYYVTGDGSVHTKADLDEMIEICKDVLAAGDEAAAHRLLNINFKRINYYNLCDTTDLPLDICNTIAYSAIYDLKMEEVESKINQGYVLYFEANALTPCYRYRGNLVMLTKRTAELLSMLAHRFYQEVYELESGDVFECIENVCTPRKNLK